MSELVRRQDLPPPGGYKPIPAVRMPAKAYFKGWQLFAGYVVMTTGAYLVYDYTRKQLTRERIEMRSSTLAITPLLIAERDREHLKVMLRNREAEAKLMANVEGWKVGTWYGEPIYKTVSSDKWVNPMFDEFYAHNHPKDIQYMSEFLHWT